MLLRNHKEKTIHLHYLLKKKSLCKWARAVQTSAVQGSIMVSYSKEFISALVTVTLTVFMNSVKFLDYFEPQVPPL